MFAELRRRLEGMVASLRAVKPERALGEELCKTDLQRLTQDIMAASRPYLADAQAARFEGEASFDRACVSWKHTPHTNPRWMMIDAVVHD